MYDYVGQYSGELTIKKGDIIEVFFSLAFYFEIKTEFLLLVVSRLQTETLKEILGGWKEELEINKVNSLLPMSEIFKKK